MALTDKLTAIANSIRSKTGTTAKMSLDDMATAISNIETGGGLPSGIKSITMGTHTLSADVGGSGSSFTVTHGLGETPDLVAFWTPTNIATTYSMLSVVRSSKAAWRSSSYVNHLRYHASSTTTVSATNYTATYGVTALTSTTMTIKAYSTSYYWRAATYNWIAIKFA